MKKMNLIILIIALFLLYFFYSNILRQWYKWQILNKSKDYEFIELYYNERIKKIVLLPYKDKNLTLLKKLEIEIKPVKYSEPFDIANSTYLSFLVAYIKLGQENACDNFLEIIKSVKGRFWGEILQTAYYTNSLYLAKSLNVFYDDTTTGTTLLHVDYEKAPETEEERVKRKEASYNYTVSIRDDALYATICLLDNRKIDWGFNTELQRYPLESFEIVNKVIKILTN